MKQNYIQKVMLSLIVCLFMATGMMASEFQVTSKSAGCSSIDGKGVASFVVTSPETQTCDLSFLIMPGEYADGTYTSVTLKVNGTTLPTPVTFDTYGWQSANTTGNAVTLNKGENTVQFISGGSDVPMVSGVNVLAYRNQYAYNLLLSKVNTTKGRVPSVEMSVDPYYGSRPLYRNGMEINQPYYNTFILPLQYNRGETAIFYVPSNTATVDFKMYLFYENPTVFSVSDTCNGNRYLFYETTIPQTGTYYLLLEAKNGGECGGVTIVANNNTTYRNAFVSNTSFNVIKSDEDNEVSNTNLPYNMFTTNLKSSDEYHEADSYLYLKEVLRDSTEIVIAYNDNNDVISDFNWGNNARIRTLLNDGISYKVGLCSMCPYSYFTPDTCDIYHSFWNNIDTMSYLSENGRDYFSKRFPRLIWEDAIESDIEGGYNCYAWAAGLTYNEIWRSTDNFSEEILWFDALFNNDTVESFYDNNICRPPYSVRYTRIGVTDDNAVIDLWGELDSLGRPESIVHASIRNTSHTPKHGYDWESKDCTHGPRFFHPRHAIRNKSYEAIVASYRIVDEDLAKAGTTPELSLYRALANEDLTIEDIKLTEEEKSNLSQMQPLQTRSAVDCFELYYNQWITHIRQYERFYNLKLFEDSLFYPQIRDYILKKPDTEYRVYKKFVDGDIPAVVLIKDIASIENSRAKSVWDKIVNASLEKGVVRTTWSNVNLFIKTMLQDEEEEILPQTGVVRSNEDDVEIIASAGGVTVTVGLEEAGKYSISAVNMQTSQQFTLLPESNQQKGERTYLYNLNLGTYIIAVVVNGNINAKKVIVK